MTTNKAVLNYICELVEIEKENKKLVSVKRNAKGKWAFEIENMSYNGILHGENYKFGGSHYLLGQIIRQYTPSDENFHISKEAYELWQKLSNDSIWDYVYTNKIKYVGTNDISLNKYTGNGNSTKPILIHSGEKFTFNDYYTDEHMIDVASIIELLTKMKNVTPFEVKKVLDQIHIARILKSEDKKLSPKFNRLKAIDYKSMDIQHICDTTYKDITLLSKKETM